MTAGDGEDRPRTRVLWVLVTLMAAGTLVKIGTEVPRILWVDGGGAATDLRKWHLLAHGWFHQPNFGGESQYAVYPPATYALLWPLVGWLSFEPARWFWTLTMLTSVVGVSWIMLRESGATTRLEKAFVCLLLPSMNATGATFGIGQVGLQVLFCTLAALLLLRRKPVTLVRDLGVTALMLLALIKPQISAPFFWVLWLRPRRWRPALLVGGAYVLITAAAILVQVNLTADPDHDTVDTSSAMLENALVKGDRATVVGTWSGGYGDLHWALFSLWELAVELEVVDEKDFRIIEMNTEASLLLLLLIGVWIWRHRGVEFWTLVGITALLARMFIYHRMYDDLLVVPATFALYRLSTAGETVSPGRRRWAWWLAVAMVLCMLAPSSMRMYGALYAHLFVGSHVILWLVVLGFLMLEAGRQRRTRSAQALDSPLG